MTRRFTTFLAAGFLAFVNVGCESPPQHSVVSDPREPWRRRVDLDYFLDAPTTARLPQTAIHEVPKDHLQAAVGILETRACIQISDQEASEFLGRTIVHPAGKRLFLVRGLCCNRETGGFSADLFRGRLWVFHGSMGSSVGAVERQPVILELSRLPKEVYVDFGVTE